MSDVRIENHGSVAIIQPVSAIGNEWVESNLVNDETVFWGGGIVAEPRYIEDVVRGMQHDGLTVEV